MIPETNTTYDPADLPGELPPDRIGEDVDPNTLKNTAVELLKNLNSNALINGAFWGDWLSLTERVRTTYGRELILRQWQQSMLQKTLSGFTPTMAAVVRPCKGSSWVAVAVDFTVRQADGLVSHNLANVGIVPEDDGTWKIWMLTTMLENFQGLGHPDQPPLGVPSTPAFAPRGLDYSVVIVGAGQGGLSLAGRLRALNIKAVVIEKASTVGSAWTSKYDTVKLHTTRDYNHLPFDRTWTEPDPELLPGPVVAEGFARYVDKYGLDVWLNSQPISCKRDDESATWTLEIATASPSNSKTHTITCRHLAIATGAGVSQPNMPFIPNSNLFAGTLMHQSRYRNGCPYAGRHAIVIGTGTTGHDIAQSLLDARVASITMIQRSPTAVYPVQWILDWQRSAYGVDVPTEISDRVGGSAPNKVASEIVSRNFAEAAKKPEYMELFDGLERAGFRVDHGQNFLGQILTRYGGYYIDVGTSQHIVDGAIKIKSGVEATSLTQSGVQFSDGTHLPADVIVLATGYEKDYRKQVAQVVGAEIAGQCREFWGLDENGDVRGVMEESRGGLWMVGGGASQARFWSRFAALLMQADLLGLNFGKGTGTGRAEGRVNGDAN